MIIVILLLLGLILLCLGYYFGLSKGWNLGYQARDLACISECRQCALRSLKKEPTKD
jgi:hypothetical protein